MSITLFGATATPADNSSLYDASERSLTPVASMVTGDLVYFKCKRKKLADIAISNTGGQTWTAGTLRQTGSSSSKVFWCRFNGTWSASPSIASVVDGTCLISLYMAVFRPTTGTNTWAADVAETYHNYTAPVSPFDVTATGQTTIAASTVAIVAFESEDNNTWSLQTGGWTLAGSAQYRNADTVSFRDMAFSVVYQIPGAPGATGNITSRQATLGGDAGMWTVHVFKEQGSGVSVSSVGDGLLHNTETGIVIAGTSFAASQGLGFVKISPTDNIADAAAVTQTVTAWADTSITITAVLSAFSYFANLYVFVQNNTGTSNAAGFVVQREAWATFTATLKNLAAVAQTGLASIRYRITTTSINGTLVDSGSAETTDGSGVISIGPLVLTSGGSYAPGDSLWVVAAQDGASEALSPGFVGKVTPTYS